MEGTVKPHTDRYHEIKVGWNYKTTSKFTSLLYSVLTIFKTLSNRTEWWHNRIDVVPAAVWVGSMPYSTAGQVAAIARCTLIAKGISNIERYGASFSTYPHSMLFLSVLQGSCVVLWLLVRFHFVIPCTCVADDERTAAADISVTGKEFVELWVKG